MDGFTAAVDRHGFIGARGWRGGAGAAVQAVRALRRRELFRIACADLLGSVPAAAFVESCVAVGQALSDVTDATLGAALRAATSRAKADEMPFAIIGMGRLGGAEMSYSSDADVLFVYEPLPGVAEDASSGSAHQIAEELRRLLSAPSPEPPLGVDADLRPEGRQGPLVRSLAAYERYYADWSKIWEAQALLRARFVAGDASLGERFLALADRVRYPDGGLTPEQITEIRRIKARVDTERLPRGADPATHAKLGRGGLADVEWAVQLLQLRHGYQVEGVRTPRTLDALAAARDAGLVSNMDAVFLSRGWVMASQVRNALMLVRGRASDQLPRQGVELAGVARALGRPPSTEPGETRGRRRRARSWLAHPRHCQGLLEGQEGRGPAAPTATGLARSGERVHTDGIPPVHHTANPSTRDGTPSGSRTAPKCSGRGCHRADQRPPGRRIAPSQASAASSRSSSRRMGSEVSVLEESSAIVASILASRVGGGAPPGDVILAQHGSGGPHGLGRAAHLALDGPEVEVVDVVDDDRPELREPGPPSGATQLVQGADADVQVRGGFTNPKPATALGLPVGAAGRALFGVIVRMHGIAQRIREYASYDAILTAGCKFYQFAPRPIFLVDFIRLTTQCSQCSNGRRLRQFDLAGPITKLLTKCFATLSFPLGAPGKPIENGACLELWVATRKMHYIAPKIKNICQLPLCRPASFTLAFYCF